MNPTRPKGVNQTLQQGILAHRVRAEELAPSARRQVAHHVHRFGGGVLLVRKDVRVGIEGDSYRGVPEYLRYVVVYREDLKA